MQTSRFYLVAVTVSVVLCAMALQAAELPSTFFRGHCVDCHSGEHPEGDVNLELAQLDWSQPATSHFWEKVLVAIDDGRMPPVDADQPTKAERAAAIRKLHALLQENVRPGGTVLRRLNRTEFENTIRVIFQVPFTVPPSFPVDAEAHGFDNVGCRFFMMFQNGFKREGR